MLKKNCHHHVCISSAWQKFSAFIFCLAIAYGSSTRAETVSPVETSVYEGKIINSITVDRRSIFEDPGKNFIFKTANSIKYPTDEDVIRSELLFKEGEPFESLRIQESERQLRALRYLRNIITEVKPVGADKVDIIVHVQDTWTLLPQVGFSSGDGKTNRSVGISDGNLGGLGKRVEVSYRQDEERNIISSVYEDNRLFGSNQRFLGGFIERSDGHIMSLYLGRPIRSLFDKHSWYINSNLGDTIGKLYENATERYIFRQRNTEVNLRYTEGVGNPAKERVDRFSLGFDFVQDAFRQATEKDYQELGLDPSKVSNDPEQLAKDRRRRGPVLTYESIVPDYISMNYIDRFDRVEDYNLGAEHDLSIATGPEFLGSYGNNLLFSGNKSAGIRFSREAFLRGEAGISSRLDEDGFSNSLARVEAKYYNVLGETCAGDWFLGRHTFASSFYVDYGDKLDKDRQLLIGGDNALRGYPARAFAGDKRTVLNLEDRIHIADNVFQVVSFGMAFFCDVGSATYNGPGSLFGKDLYADVGAGLRFAFPRSSGGQVLRLDFGIPLRRADDGTNHFELRIIMAGGQLFSSRLLSETTGPEKAYFSLGVDR